MVVATSKPASKKNPSKSKVSTTKSKKPSPKVVAPPPALEKTKPALEKTKPTAASENPQPVSSIAPENVTIESSLSDSLKMLGENITSLAVALNKMKGDFKTLEKQVIREARTMDKVNAKRNKSKGSRAPSGFVKPASISKELAKFLGVAEDIKMARTDVTKLITAYVKNNKLQAPDNGRKILPDKKLMSLLNCKSSDEVTYFNLQKYMKPHFIKNESSVV